MDKNNNMRKNILFSIVVCLFALGANAQCLPFSFVFTTTEASCPNNNDAVADVAVSGGMAPYIYAWSTGSGPQLTSAEDSLAPGNYSVIVADMMGCIDTGYVTINATPIPTPSICMVTVDAHSVNNFIYWDQSAYTNVDSFIIYRETAASVYSRIGAVSSDSLSQFEDTARSVGPANGDPNLASYRYKIQILDTCGNYGAMSPYHSTIYIIDNGAGEFSWAVPYTIEGAANPVTSYILLCDTANVDNWGPVQAVPGSDTLANDPGFSNHSSIANWRVKTAWGISCTPTRTTVNTTRSNIKHGSALSTGIISENLPGSIAIYPNPAREEFSIALPPGIKTAGLRIENMMGQLLYEETINASGTSGISKQINISGYAKGIYLISVESNGNKAFKKLVVD